MHCWGFLRYRYILKRRHSHLGLSGYIRDLDHSLDDQGLYTCCSLQMPSFAGLCEVQDSRLCAGSLSAFCVCRAKFGLRPAEIVALVESLSAREMLNCLQLLHFHAGSQVHPYLLGKEYDSGGQRGQNILRSSTAYQIQEVVQDLSELGRDGVL